MLCIFFYVVMKMRLTGKRKFSGRDGKCSRLSCAPLRQEFSAKLNARLLDKSPREDEDCA
jgi:hypothetical protein